MEELLTNLLSNSQGLFAYLSVFAILVACGLGVPLPEDISLILGGYLAHQGAASLSVMMFVGFAGILVGDSLIFFAGRRLGSKVGRKSTGFFARVVTPEKRARVEGMFAQHGQKIVMVARFLPGVRAVTYFTAGSAGMKYWRFLVWDGIAALLSAPFFVYLGFRFGGELEVLTEKLKNGQVVVMVALVALGGGFFLWKRRQASQLARQKALAEAALPAPPAVLGLSGGEAVASEYFDAAPGAGVELTK